MHGQYIGIIFPWIYFISEKKTRQNLRIDIAKKHKDLRYLPSCHLRLFHFPSCDCPSIYLVISVKRQISNLQQQRIYCEDTRIIICRLVLKDGWSYKILDRAVQTVVLELTFILTNIGKMISIKAVQKQLLMWRNYSSFFMWFIFNTGLFNSISTDKNLTFFLVSDSMNLIRYKLQSRLKSALATLTYYVQSHLEH